MAFDARQHNVGKLLNDAIYRIPRNQRPYVWVERNWAELFRDLKLVSEVSKDDSSVTPHFLGSIVLKQEESEAGLSVYTVIDGQQRILTLTILLASILFMLKKKGKLDDAAGTEKYVLAKDNKGMSHEIVDPEQHAALPKLIRGVVASSLDDLRGVSPKAFSKRFCLVKRDEVIAKAFVFFSIEVDKLSDGGIIALRDSLINAQYVNISSSTEEDLYTIFEILNARGLPLADGDLLKNYIMRYIQPRAKRDDAKTQWAEIERTVGDNMGTFLRHYAIQCCRLSSGDKEGVYTKIRDFTDPTRATELLDDLTRKVGYYERILNPPAADGANRTVLSFLRAHRVRVFRPLVMSLMHLLDLEKITQSDYDQSLDFIYRFYVCYKIIGGLASNQLTDAIGKYAYALEKAFKGRDTLEEWRTSFLDKLPAKETFTKRFETLGWSHTYTPYKGSTNKDQCKVVLEMLERQKDGNAQLEDYTIEHLLLDADNEVNAQIGNLVLLEEELNNSCGERPLAEKFQILRKSRFVTTRSVAERYIDKEFDPVERTAFLADYVYSLLVNGE